GLLESEDGQQAAALRSFERGLAVVAPVFAKHPDNAPRRGQLIDLRLGRAAALAYLGQYEQAASEADNVAQEKSLTANNLYNVACVFSVASTAANKDDKPSTRIGTHQYAARAIELLKRAEVAGFFRLPGNLSDMQKDKDLAPLRSNPEFQKLLADIEAKL